MSDHQTPNKRSQQNQSHKRTETPGGKYGGRSEEMNAFREQLGISENDQRPLGEFIQEKREYNPSNFLGDKQIRKGTKTNHKSWWSDLGKEQEMEVEEAPEAPERLQAKCAECGGTLPPPDGEGDGDAKGATGGPCPKCAAKAAAQAPEGEIIQRTPEDKATTETPATEEVVNENNGQWIVQDGDTPKAGQMNQTVFMELLEARTCATVDAALAGMPFSSKACPYIAKAFGRHQSSTPKQLEAVMNRYAPMTRSAASARHLVLLIQIKIGAAARNWVRTGDLSQIPGDIAARIPASVKLMAKAQRAVSTAVDKVKGVGQAIAGGAKKAWAGFKKIFFRAKPGGAQQTRSAPEVVGELGEGRPLEGGVRSKMEGALGGDFSRVRVHSGGTAAQLSSEMNAEAFAVGDHVAFGSGKYKPGTIVGDALLAHELAHVQQQEHGALEPDQDSDDAAVEQDADRAATGAVASVLTGERQSWGARIRSGLSIRRCGGVPDDFTEESIPEGYDKLPVLKESDLPVIDKLTEMSNDPALMAAYKDTMLLEGAFGTRQTTASRCASSSPTPMAAGTGLGGQMALSDQQQELLKELKRYGISSYYTDFLGLKKQFTDIFQRYALQTAFSMMRMSKQVIEASQRDYVDSAVSSDPFQNLWKALAPIREIQGEITARQEAFNDMVTGATTNPDGSRRMVSAYAFAEPARQKLEQDEKDRKRGMEIAKGLSTRFPVLASEVVNFTHLGTSDPSVLREGLGGAVTDHLEHIRTTQYNLVDSPDQVWKLAPVIEQAKMGMGIAPGSIHEDFIKWQVQHVKQIDEVVNLALAVLGIGLGLLSGGTGTVAVLALIGSAGVGIASFAYNYDDYQFKHSANRTDFDKAKALTAEDPSMFWLALDIVFVAADIAAAARMLRAARPIVNSVQAAGGSADELAQALKGNSVFSDASNYKAGQNVDSATKKVGQSYDQVQEAATQVKNLKTKLPEDLPKSVEDLLMQDARLRQAVTADPSLINAGNMKAWEDIAKYAPVNMETYELLLRNPTLRESLAEFPETARWIKKCASPCFPPDITKKQLKKINKFLKAAENAGTNIADIKINEFLYQYRGRIDDAIKEIEAGKFVAPKSLSGADVVSEIPELAARQAEVEALLAKGYSSAQIKDILKSVSGDAAKLDEMMGFLNRAVLADPPPRNINHVLYGLSDSAKQTDMLATLRRVNSGGHWNVLDEFVEIDLIAHQMDTIIGASGSAGTLRAMLTSNGMSEAAFRTYIGNVSAIVRRPTVTTVPWGPDQLRRLFGMTQPDEAVRHSQEMRRWLDVHAAPNEKVTFQMDLPGNHPPVGFKDNGRLGLGSSRADGWLNQTSLLHASSGHNAREPLEAMTSGARSRIGAANRPGQYSQWASDREMLLAAEMAWQRHGRAAATANATEILFEIPAGWGRVFWATSNPPPGAILRQAGTPPVYEVVATHALVVFRQDGSGRVFRTFYPVLP